MDINHNINDLIDKTIIILDVIEKKNNLKKKNELIKNIIAFFDYILLINNINKFNFCNSNKNNTFKIRAKELFNSFFTNKIIYKKIYCLYTKHHLYNKEKLLIDNIYFFYNIKNSNPQSLFEKYEINKKDLHFLSNINNSIELSNYTINKLADNTKNKLNIKNNCLNFKNSNHELLKFISLKNDRKNFFKKTYSINIEKFCKIIVIRNIFSKHQDYDNFLKYNIFNCNIENTKNHLYNFSHKLDSKFYDEINFINKIKYNLENHSKFDNDDNLNDYDLEYYFNLWKQNFYKKNNIDNKINLSLNVLVKRIINFLCYFINLKIEKNDDENVYCVKYDDLIYGFFQINYNCNQTKSFIINHNSISFNDAKTFCLLNISKNYSATFQDYVYIFRELCKTIIFVIQNDFSFNYHTFGSNEFDSFIYFFELLSQNSLVLEKYIFYDVSNINNLYKIIKSNEIDIAYRFKKKIYIALFDIYIHSYDELLLVLNNIINNDEDNSETVDNYLLNFNKNLFYALFNNNIIFNDQYYPFFSSLANYILHSKSFLYFDVLNKLYAYQLYNFFCSKNYLFSFDTIDTNKIFNLFCSSFNFYDNIIKFTLNDKLNVDNFFIVNNLKDKNLSQDYYFTLDKEVSLILDKTSVFNKNFENYYDINLSSSKNNNFNSINQKSNFMLSYNY